MKRFIILLLFSALSYAAQGIGGKAGIGGQAGFGGGTSVSTPLCSAVSATNLLACYDSSVGLTCTSGCSNGNAVTTWADQSVNGNNLTCSSCGVYEGAQINGQPAIQFNGTSNFYSFTTAIPSASIAAITVYVVFNVNTTTATYAFVYGSTSGGLIYQTDGGGTGKMQDLFITAGIGTGTASQTTTWHQANMSNATSPTGYAFRLDRAADGSGGSSEAPSQPLTSVGYDAQFTNSYLAGDIAAIIIYGADLSGTGAMTTNESALNTKYGL